MLECQPINCIILCYVSEEEKILLLPFHLICSTTFVSGTSSSTIGSFFEGPYLVQYYPVVLTVDIDLGAVLHVFGNWWGPMWIILIPQIREI